MMMSDGQRAVVKAAAPRPAPPLRGTQSFVGVMAEIWGRPGLTALEILWRWVAAGPALLLLWWSGSRALRGVPWHESALEAMTVFKPSEAADVMARQLRITLPHILPVLRWWVPLALLVWSVAAALGRTEIWKRLDPVLQPRYVLVGSVGLLRASALLATFVLWVFGALEASQHLVTAPAAAGREPSLVLLVASLVVVTLLLFMAWSLLSWVGDALPLFLMMPAEVSHGSANDGQIDQPRRLRTLPEALRDTWSARELRAKLIEINLVMGIIKIALLVLGMVFSASPLPFATAETTHYLTGWWIFVAGLYLAFSDLFQVIRRTAYLRLFQVLATSGSDTMTARRSAS